MPNLRRLGQSDLRVSPVGMGLWPIAGMTTLGTHPDDSRQTILAALASGINFFDTAYCYGADGLSERLLGSVAAEHREEMLIATKGGVHWDEELNRVNDASPARLRFEREASQRRLNVRRVDLYYLHSPDEKTPIRESAAALAEFQSAGWARYLGVSNVTLGQLQEFHAECPVSAVQLRYNMLQREIEREVVPWCQENQVAIVAYWPLMKGLLAGRIRRGFCFDPQDKRQTYSQFQGEEWERNQQLLDRLDDLAADFEVTLVTLVLAWTLAQPGITCVLCGAKRPWQIQESAAAMNWTPTTEQLARIDEVLAWRASL